MSGIGILPNKETGTPEVTLRGDVEKLLRARGLEKC